MKIKLNAEAIAAIEEGLNRKGTTEVSVKIEHGNIVVIVLEKKRIF